MPSKTQSHKVLLAVVVVVGILVLLYGLVLLVLNTPSRQTVPPVPVTQSTVPKLSDSVPAPAPAGKDFVSAQQASQYLVVHSDLGFYPHTISVAKGETVRFSNSADADAQFAAGAVASPVLTKGEYWQYTFDTAGTYEFKDAKGAAIVVTVK